MMAFPHAMQLWSDSIEGLSITCSNLFPCREVACITECCTCSAGLLATVNDDKLLVRNARLAVEPDSHVLAVAVDAPAVPLSSPTPLYSTVAEHDCAPVLISAPVAVPPSGCCSSAPVCSIPLSSLRNSSTSLLPLSARSSAISWLTVRRGAPHEGCRTTWRRMPGAKRRGGGEEGEGDLDGWGREGEGEPPGGWAMRRGNTHLDEVSQVRSVKLAK